MGFYFSKCCSASTLFTTSSLTRGRVMPQWHCMQRDKIRLNPLEVQGEEKTWCYSLVRVFIFVFLHKVPTHLSFLRLFLCIFSLIPLLIQVLMSQRLLVASSVGINLTAHNFGGSLSPQLIFYQKLSFCSRPATTYANTNYCIFRKGASIRRLHLWHR